MELENQVQKEIWLVLQTIKKYHLLTPSDEYVSYQIRDLDIDPEVQRKILNKLKSEGAIKIKSEAPLPFFGSAGLTTAYGIPSMFYKLDVLLEPFESLYKQYAELNGHSYELSGTQLPYFDVKSSKIIIGKKQCVIDLGSNQAILCKALFSKQLGEWLEEIDVIDNFYRGRKGARSFYHAVRAVNKKVKDEIGTTDLLHYDASKVRVRAELFESK